MTDPATTPATKAQPAPVVYLSDIIDEVLRHHPEANPEILYKAYTYSAKVHQGQVRQSGEPYLTHPMQVAQILARMRMDSATVAVGLLHDTVEDTWATLEDVEETFGGDIARMVDDLTKIGKLRFRNPEERYAENFRKMLLATTRDVRVLAVKMADRLHNMRTLQFVPDEKRLRIARETMEIYAPLAGRLGMQWVKNELEDLAFKYLEPDTYAEIKAHVNQKRTEREAFIERFIAELRQSLQKNGIEAEVSGRPKHLYSIHKKMRKRGIDFDQLYDLMAFRVMVNDVADCYRALGVVHNHWRPVPGRFKDYIATPKSNMYQSLHTSVFGPEDQRVEIQIRTGEMHEVAEVGVAAHWTYKDGTMTATMAEAQYYAWLRDVLTLEESAGDSLKFLEDAKHDLFAENVFVFTPKGDVLELPKGATVLDFAYKIHTEVGHRCIGATIDGRWVSIRHTLVSGNIVKVQTQETQHPARDWLKFVRTSHARSKIRAYYSLQERSDLSDLGKKLAHKAFKQAGLSHDRMDDPKFMDDLMSSLGLRGGPEELYGALAQGKIPPARLREKLKPVEPEAPAIRKPLAALQTSIGRMFGRRDATQEDGDIVVDGLDDLVLRLARCCKPIRGDRIVGFVTRGHGITIHRQDCKHIEKAEPHRILSASWGRAEHELPRKSPVRIRVKCADDPGQLARMSHAISKQNVNIQHTSVHSIEGGAEGTFTVEVDDRDELDRVLRALTRTRGVLQAERVH